MITVSRLILLGSMFLPLGVLAEPIHELAKYEEKKLADGTSVICLDQCTVKELANGTVKVTFIDENDAGIVSVKNTSKEVKLTLDTTRGEQTYLIPQDKLAAFLRGIEQTHTDQQDNVAKPIPAPPYVIAPKAIETDAIETDPASLATGVTCPGGCTVHKKTVKGVIVAAIELATHTDMTFEVKATQEAMAISVSVSAASQGDLSEADFGIKTAAVKNLDVMLPPFTGVQLKADGYLHGKLPGGFSGSFNGTSIACAMDCDFKLSIDATGKVIGEIKSNGTPVFIKSAAGVEITNTYLDANTKLTLAPGQAGGFEFTRVMYTNGSTGSPKPGQQVAQADTSGLVGDGLLPTPGPTASSPGQANPSGIQPPVTLNEDLNASGQPAALGGLGPLGAWPAIAFSIDLYPPVGVLTSHTLNGTGALTSFNQEEYGSSTNSGSSTSVTVCAPSACPQPAVVRWGTWADGDVSIGSVNPTATSPLHYLIGSATAPGVIDARTGTVIFNHLGGTTPTGVDGTVYSKTVGSLSVNFTAATANLSSYSVTPVSGPGATAYAFSNVPLTMVTVTTSQFAIKQIHTTSLHSGTNNGQLEINGLFLGASGNHVGAAFNVRDSSNSSVKINSVQVFKE